DGGERRGVRAAGEAQVAGAGEGRHDAPVSGAGNVRLRRTGPDVSEPVRSVWDGYSSLMSTVAVPAFGVAAMMVTVDPAGWRTIHSAFARFSMGETSRHRSCPWIDERPSRWP